MLVEALVDARKLNHDADFVARELQKAFETNSPKTKPLANVYVQLVDQQRRAGQPIPKEREELYAKAKQATTGMTLVAFNITRHAELTMQHQGQTIKLTAEFENQPPLQETREKPTAPTPAAGAEELGFSVEAAGAEAKRQKLAAAVRGPLIRSYVENQSIEALVQAGHAAAAPVNKQGQQKKADGEQLKAEGKTAEAEKKFAEANQCFGVARQLDSIKTKEDAAQAFQAFDRLDHALFMQFAREHWNELYQQLKAVDQKVEGMSMDDIDRFMQQIEKASKEGKERVDEVIAAFLAKLGIGEFEPGRASGEPKKGE